VVVDANGDTQVLLGSLDDADIQAALAKATAA